MWMHKKMWANCKSTAGRSQINPAAALQFTLFSAYTDWTDANCPHFWFQLRAPRWCHLYKQLQESPGPNLCQKVPSDNHGQTAGVGNTSGLKSLQCVWVTSTNSQWKRNYCGVCLFFSPQGWKWELHETSVRYLWGDIQGRPHSHPEKSEIQGGARECPETQVYTSPIFKKPKHSEFGFCCRFTKLNLFSLQTAELRRKALSSHFF